MITLSDQHSADTRQAAHTGALCGGTWQSSLSFSSRLSHLAVVSLILIVILSGAVPDFGAAESKDLGFVALERTLAPARRPPILQLRRANEECLCSG